MKIRKATGKDLDAVSALYVELFSAMAQLQPQFFRGAEQNRVFMESILNNSSADMLVAEIDTQIVGFALVLEQRTPPYTCLVQQTYAFLMDIAVADKHQGRGVGTALIKAVEDWTRKRGLSYLELNVLWENERAKCLYEKVGFKGQMVTMGRHIQ